MDSFFSPFPPPSPPLLPLYGGMYAVIEKDMQIRIICLDALDGRLVVAATGFPSSLLLAGLGAARAGDHWRMPKA